MLGPYVALTSSLTGGISDFLAGTTSRRVGTLQFMFCAQLIGLVLAGGWVAISAAPVPPALTLVAATGAGLGLLLNLAAFFQAMVVRKISVVAPISATGVVLPIMVGIANGERPDPEQAVGTIAAIAGIVLATRPSRQHPTGTGESGVGLALLAALGGGLFFWLMASGSRHGVPWAVLAARAIPAIILAVAVRTRRAALRPVLDSPTPYIVLVCALLAFFGMVFYAFATLHGPLAIISVLGSLYPVVTVLLAYRVLGERVRGAQTLGIVAVLAGVVLLSV